MSLFNYSTLNVSLNKQNRSLHITLNRSEYQNSFNFEVLFELESILAWASNKLEISTILFSGVSSFFSSGISLESIQKNPDRLEKFLTKFRKITSSLHYLPQTTICDIGTGTSNIGCEFALNCDLRISHCLSFMEFNHLKMGLTPSAGGIGLLKSCVGPARAKNWIFMTKKVFTEELMTSGLALQTYDSLNRQEVIDTILTNIDTQAPVSRMQAKMAFFESIRSELESTETYETKISKANILTFDWVEAQEAHLQKRTPEFMKAKSFKYVLDHSKDLMTE